MSQNLRAEMPTVAAWIDQLREAFGADQINPSIKAGIQGQPTFWAKENGLEAGTPHPNQKNAMERAADPLPHHPCNGCADHLPTIIDAERGIVFHRCGRHNNTCPNRCPFWRAP